MVEAADLLRSPAGVGLADPRTQYLSVFTENTRLPRPITIDDQHDAISCFVLNDSTPIDIAVSFETAKNLYLYAWYVFRFYPVAEQQAFSTLELALRYRFPTFVSSRIDKTGRPPSLKPLLLYAIENKVISNENFPRRRIWAKERARSKYLFDTVQMMHSAGLSEVLYDDLNIEPTKADLEHDFLGDFVKIIPKLRNDLAHGSPTLRHTVLHTFDLIASMINQLYL